MFYSSESKLGYDQKPQHSALILTTERKLVG